MYIAGNISTTKNQTNIYKDSNVFQGFFVILCKSNKHIYVIISYNKALVNRKPYETPTVIIAHDRCEFIEILMQTLGEGIFVNGTDKRSVVKV